MMIIRMVMMTMMMKTMKTTLQGNITEWQWIPVNTKHNDITIVKKKRGTHTHTHTSITA